MCLCASPLYFIVKPLHEKLSAQIELREAEFDRGFGKENLVMSAAAEQTYTHFRNEDISLVRQQLAADIHDVATSIRAKYSERLPYTVRRMIPESDRVSISPYPGGRTSTEVVLTDSGFRIITLHYTESRKYLATVERGIDGFSRLDDVTLQGMVALLGGLLSMQSLYSDL